MATLEDTRVETLSVSTSVKRDFSTTRLRMRVATEHTPAVASARAYLRASLPDIYRDEGFSMRFLEGLEAVLDPIVATLDALPSYFDPALAPRDLLDLMAAWLGVSVGESWPDKRVRDALRSAGELGQRRGTRKGLELTLGISFPDLPLRVEDGGHVTWTEDPDAADQAAANAFVVYCDKPIDEAKQAEIVRVIEQAKPVHVRYLLRVKAARKRSEGDAE